MEERRIEGLWDCVSCGTKGIKARYDACVSCGKPRGMETVFYLPDDLAAATLTEEEKAKILQMNCKKSVQNKKHRVKL